MPTLVACPWCGKSDELEIARPMQPAGSNYCVVRCNRCGISGPRGENAMARDERTRRRIPGIDAEASAADAWNRRPVHPDARRLDLIERHGLTVKKQGEDWLASDPAYDCLVSEFTARAAIDAAKKVLEGEAKP